MWLCKTKICWKCKKLKAAKKCVIKREFKFQDYKNCLEAAQAENKINHFQKTKIDVESHKEDKKEFIKINKLTLKQRFRSAKQNAITDDKRMQSIDSIETYAYGMNKDLV